MRSLTSFQVAATGKDYIALTSDSGNLSLIECDSSQRKFIVLFNEPFAKSGIRRLSPGNEIVVDSKGRTLFLTAMERDKLAYVVNRDWENQLTVGSPVEVKRTNWVTMHSIGLDVGFENPIFAAIEMQNVEGDEEERKKWLVYYEFDLGLNHILKKHQEEIPCSSNYLLAVPGGDNGPSGVLVCSKNRISYRNLQGDKLSVSIPQTANEEEGGSQEQGDSYVVCGATHTMKDHQFFFLVQTNHCDLFKLTLPQDRTLTISYFDTLPAIASTLLVMKAGWLWCDSEYGDKYYFQFESLGPDVPDSVSSSDDDNLSKSLFQRSEELTNLSLTDVVETLNPLLSTCVTPSGQILSLSGLQGQSHFKTLDRGVKVEEIVESVIPGVAQSVFSTKLQKGDDSDKLLVLSFVNSTMVLEIGESVEEVADSWLVLKEATLALQQIGQSSILQVLPTRIVVFQNDGKQINEWHPPGGIKITQCSATNRQCLVALSSNEAVYFEVDEYDRLVEYQDHFESDTKIISVAIGDATPGTIRGPFMAIGSADATVRVLSCDPQHTMELLSMFVVSSTPHSLLFSGADELHIGLTNGVFIRQLLDQRTGTVVPHKQRMKYLGSQPVTLGHIYVDGDKCVLAFSSGTPWIIHHHIHHQCSAKELVVSPLLTADTLTAAVPLRNSEFANACVALHGKSLKIFQLSNEDLNKSNPANLQGLELKSTARQILTHEDEVVVVGWDYVHVFGKGSGEICKSLDLLPNEKCHSAAIVEFEAATTYLCLSVQNSKTGLNYIHSVQLNTFEIVHTTKLTASAYTMIPFNFNNNENDKKTLLLVGVGNELRTYDLGLKQLLCKSTTTISSVSQIVALETTPTTSMPHGRLMVADIRESVTFMKWDHSNNEFIPLADDIIPRHVSSMKTLDRDTVVIGDKFGNLSLLRLYSSNSNNNKVQNLVNFHIGDIPLSIHSTPLTPSGQQVILYSCLQGTIGTMIPLVTKSDIGFFKTLQNSIRTHYKDLTGRSNLKFRSLYQPVKNCIDGDLIEMFNTQLNETRQMEVAKEVGKDVEEIKRRIWEVVNNSI